MIYKLINFLKPVNCVWIGDPCYVIPDELWDDVCDQGDGVIEFDFYELQDIGYLPPSFMGACQRAGVDNLKFILYGTAYGDGDYNSKSGFQYGVDSGCLGIIPEHLIDPEKLSDASKHGKFFTIGKTTGIKRIELQITNNGQFDFFLNGDNCTCESIFTGDENAEDEYN